MSDRTSGSGDTHPTGRIRRPQDEDWTPEDARREPLPEEWLPGEPAPEPGAPARRAGSVGPGSEGLTGDDLTPEDAPVHRPDPAVMGGSASRRPAGMGSSASRRPDDEERSGTEGLRPGTEDLASGPSGTSDLRGPEASGGTRPRADESGAPGESLMPDDGLGAPSSGEPTAREAHGTESRGPDAWPAAPGAPAAPAPAGTGAPLLSHDETDRWERRMRELAAGFVEEPRGAVEKADHALEEIAGRFEEAVERRRRTLRRSWEASEDRGPGSDADTEQLRLALRDYRDLAERLLHS
ncbi:hypothetical protein [Streptomyces sp. NPDC046942]|uniref:hypothetical protein n=1 Tax=Streptomyces sp. NPDC046942 TaxID=3155137 RepID=UPI0033FDCA72